MDGTILYNVHFRLYTLYSVPEVLLAVGRHVPDHFVDRSRMSVTYEEARAAGAGGNGGYGLTTPDDCLFWWGRGSYALLLFH